MNDYYTTVTQALSAYDDMIDECDTVTLGTLTYDASRVLRLVDPIAYRCGFHDWLDSEGIDSDELDGWDQVDL